MTEHEFERLPDNSSRPIELEGANILLCNSGGKHYAIANRCTHQDTPLTDGRIRNGFISCPLHGVRFELATGEPRGELTRVALQTYQVSEKEDRIIVSTTE